MNSLRDLIEAATLTKLATADERKETSIQRIAAGLTSLLPTGAIIAPAVAPKGTGWSTFWNSAGVPGLGAYVGSNPAFNTKRSNFQELKDVALTSLVGTGVGAGFAANSGHGLLTSLGGALGIGAGLHEGSNAITKSLIKHKLINKIPISALVPVAGLFGTLGGAAGALSATALQQLFD